MILEFNFINVSLYLYVEFINIGLIIYVFFEKWYIFYIVIFLIMIINCNWILI